jgi:hypothetical protein
MDTIVTLEGRRQMADGKLRIEYVSFTDGATFYDPDVISGSADPTTRLYFEQCHLPQDQITFEADDSGKLKPFKNVQGITAASSGKIYINYSSSIEFDYLSGSQFASSAGSLLASSISNFKNLQSLSTKDYIFEDEGFSVTPSKISFKISNHLPINLNHYTRNITELDSLFDDKNLSRQKNFKYLPPINKIENQSIDRKDPNVITANKIGDYPNDHLKPVYSPKKLEEELKIIEDKGFLKKLTFDPTSLGNNIVAQFFEINSTEIKKLDIIDYGSYQYLDSMKHAYFVGKVLNDDNGCQTFVKMFTLVFE